MKCARRQAGRNENAQKETPGRRKTRGESGCLGDQGGKERGGQKGQLTARDAQHAMIRGMATIREKVGIKKENGAIVGR